VLRERTVLKRPFVSILCALVATAVVVGAGMTLASAAGGGGGNTAKVFGKGGDRLKPFCKDSPERGSCQVLGSLTAFINKLNGKEDPFVAPSDGKIVAWSIELGEKPSDKPFPDDPDSSNLEFFQDTFGSEKHGNGPTGRIAILKPQDGARFKLVRHGPLMDLGGPFYDQDTIITLTKPLRIRAGEIVGFSSYTWVPTLKPHREGDGINSWRANREQGECDADGIINGKPHKRLDSVRTYGCEFSDRLFYRAYFKPNN
jgi:hypothetical protein